MKNNKLKIGFAICVLSLASIVANAQSLTRTITMTAGSVSNLLSVADSGGARITQVILTSPAAASSRINIYDSPTNVFTWTNAAYQTVTPTITNFITSYVNYYGATNTFTNVALIAVTNTVAANTNNYSLVFAGVAATNSSATYDGPYFFRNGAWATNATVGGTATVTITYER